MNANELEDLAQALLEEGVPAAVVSRALRVSLDAVKDAQSKMRVRRYGTDDMTDYLEEMQWKAVEEALRIIETGSAADKKSYLGMVLGKQMVIAGRRTPESQRRNTENIDNLMKQFREGTASTRETEPSPFAVNTRPPDSAPYEGEDNDAGS